MTRYPHIVRVSCTIYIYIYILKLLEMSRNLMSPLQTFRNKRNTIKISFIQRLSLLKSPGLIKDLTYYYEWYIEYHLLVLIMNFNSNREQHKLHERFSSLFSSVLIFLIITRAKIPKRFYIALTLPLLRKAYLLLHLPSF